MPRERSNKIKKLVILNSGFFLLHPFLANSWCPLKDSSVSATTGLTTNMAGLMPLQLASYQDNSISPVRLLTYFIY